MTRAIVVCGALLLSCGASSAAIDQGLWFLSLYGGEYRPGAEFFEDDTTVGVHFGAAFTEHVSITGTIGIVSFDEEVLGPTGGTVDVDLTLVEGSLWYAFLPAKRVSPALGGGIGGAFASSDVTLTGPPGGFGFDDLTEESLTLHAGAGVTIELNDKLYLRLASQWRWFENRDEDEIDLESTFGIGFTWGDQ